MEDTPSDHFHSYFSISFGSNNAVFPFFIVRQCYGEYSLWVRFQSSISDLYLIEQCLPSNFVEKQLLRQKGKSLL